MGDPFNSHNDRYQADGPSDRPTPHESGKAIEAATRCWLLHRWSPWMPYETVRPAGASGPSRRHAAEVVELRRRRHCVRCGKRDDRHVRERRANGGQ
jgi:hypothetical protein